MSFINKILGLGLSFLLLIAVLVPTIYADETTPVSPDNQAAVEPSPTPTPEPSVSPSPEPSVSPSPTPTPSQVPSTDPTPAPSDLPSPSPSASPDASPSAAPESIPEALPTPTPAADTVVLDQTYFSSFNNNVSVKFTVLPANSGTISFNEIQLSDSQKQSVGALSGTAYDISSSMINGTFTYDLTLPIPAGANAQNLSIKFAQSLSDLANAQNVTQSFSVNSDNTVTIHGLDHFTVFVVVNPNDQTSCDGVTIGTIPGATCFSTVQAAIDGSTSGDTINIASGTYSENVVVNKNLTLHGVDTGAGNPTVSSFIFWAPNISINNINVGSIVNGSPVVALTNPINNSNKTSVSITGTGLANANVNYTVTDAGSAHSVSGTGTVNGSGNINITGINASALNDGSITLSVTLDDGAGHMSTAATANSFKDAALPAAPVVSFTTNPINNANKTNVSISIAGEAGATINYSISDGVNPAITGSGTIPGSGTFTVNKDVSGLNDGTLTLSATQTDSSGNVSSAGTNTVTKDTVAPNVSAGANKVTNAQFTQNGVVNDPAPTSGILSYAWTKTAGPGTITFGTSNAISTTVSANADGVYTIQLTVTDVAGNSASSTFSLTWDQTAPAVSANNVIAGWFTVNPNITLSASDGLSGLNNVRYNWDAPATAVSGTVFVNGATINIPSDGTHTLNLYADDNATNSQPFSAVYRLDTQNPVVSVTGSSASWQTILPVITVSDSDTLPGSGVSTVTYQWDGGSLIATSNGVNITASFPGDGIHSLDLLVTDVSGRTGTFHGTYMIDRVNPTDSGTPATITPTNSTTQVWNFAVSTDATSGIAQYVWRTMLGASAGPSGTAPANATSVTTNLTEGVWTFFIKAVDVAGNQSNEVSGNVMVDTTNPVTTDTGTDNLWHNAPVDVTLSCTDNLSGCTQLIYTTDGSDPTVSGTRVMVNSDHTTIHLSSEGVYTIKYYSLDAAGNQEATKLAANQVKIDTTLPTVSTDNIIAGWFTVNPTITLSVSDLGGSLLNNVRYNWDAPATAVTGTVFTNGVQINIPSDGVHTLYLYADDNATNQSFAYSATYRLDTVNPAISATGSSAGWQTSIPTITVSATDTLPGSDVASVQYQWDGGAFNGTNDGADLTATLQALGDGVHTLTINITDVSGRTNQFVGTYKIDTVNPSTSDDTDNLWHNIPVTVNLTCFDATSGCQKITYTTDGSDPTASATAVMVLGNTANIILNSDGVYTIQYFSNDVAGNIEAVQTAANHVMIDQTIPVISGVNLANVTTGNNLYVKDGDTVSITATVTDLNNQNLLTASMITANLSSIGGGVSVNPVSYDNLNGLATWANVVVSGSGNGVITITIDANDIANNPAVQQNVTSTADNINPVTTDDVDGLWHNASVTVTLNCNDVNNCAQTYYTTDGSTPTLASNQGTSILLNVDGVYTIKYFSVDVAGNTEAAQTAVNQVMIDLTASVISNVTLNNITTGNSTYVKDGDTVFLTATVTDNNQALLTVGMITANLSGLGGGTAVNPVSYNSATGLATWANLVVSGSGNGMITITVDGSDVANNPAVQQNVTTTADNITPVAPGVTLPNPINLANQNSAALTINGEVGTTANYTISDGVNPNITGSALIGAGGNVLVNVNVSSLNDGNLNVSVTLTDLAGNISLSTSTIVAKDAVAPTLSATAVTSSNANGAFAKVGDSVTLTFTSSEAIQIPTITIAGHIVVPTNVGNNWTAAWTMAAADAQGPISYLIVFQDIAGNLGTTVNANSAINFDQSAPSGTWTQPVANANVSGIVNLSANISDNISGIASVTFQYQISGGAGFTDILTVNNPTSPVSTTWDTNVLALDLYTLRMVITDNAGNSTNVDQAVGVATVITPPAAPAVATSSNSITINWTTDDPTTSRVIYDTTSHSSLGAAPNYGYANSTVESDLGKVLSHSVALSGLSSGTVYYYRMVSHGSPEAVSNEFSFQTLKESQSLSSASAPVCTDSAPGSAPAILSITVSGDGKVTLIWKAAKNPVTYYLIKYGLGHDDYQFGVPNTGNVTSYEIGGLTLGQTYYFRVRAGNNCATGEFSNEMSVKVNGSSVQSAVNSLVSGISNILGANDVYANEGEVSPSASATESAQPQNTETPKPVSVNSSTSNNSRAKVLIILGALLLAVSYHFAKSNSKKS